MIQDNNLFQLKKIIKEIKSFPEQEWMRIEIFQKYVNNLNNCSTKLGLNEFIFEEFHYSNTGKTINPKGYNSLINHISMLEELLANQENETKREKADNDESKKIFIVHGRDRQSLSEIENIIRRIGLEPIVLNRMASSGATIIEKFEKHSDVRFAIVLLTPDDIGSLNEEPLDYSFRARQNVLFELGFFYGKLGRQNVCCIIKNNVEKPSDIDGIMYLRYTSHIEEIQYDLMKELDAISIKFKAFN